MLESFLITSRETLEASLIVGIVLAYLTKTNNQHYKKTVYAGILIGVFASILAAVLFNVIAGGFEGMAEELFEGVTMLLGAILLTTMIFWMLQQRNIADEIRTKVVGHLEKSHPFFSHGGLFLLIAIAILREGVETVIFLHATNYSNGISLISATLGIVVAIAVGYLFFIGVRKFNLKRVFTVSSLLLILFAAGLVAQSVHEFQEAGVITFWSTALWDLNPTATTEGIYPLLHEKGVIGSFLKGLFGYNGNPSGFEVGVYTGYLLFVFFLWKNLQQKAASKKNQQLLNHNS